MGPGLELRHVKQVWLDDLMDSKILLCLGRCVEANYETNLRLCFMAIRVKGTFFEQLPREAMYFLDSVELSEAM